jgi:chemotaxis protein MotB
MRPTHSLPLLASVLLLSLPACVKKSTHQVALDDLARARAGHDTLQEEMGRELAARDEREAELRAEAAALRRRIAELEQEIERLERLHGQAEARFGEAQMEVDRLEVLLNDRGTEYRRLQQRLQSLAAIEREVRERNQIYEDVIGRFRSLIDGGRLSVAIDRGRMVIQLPQDILFQSGSATIGADGSQTLGEVAAVLADLADRTFQVEGHTDNVPIATARFPSNWELSSARALSVVRLLVQNGVPPANVSGAGYGEFQPRASNDTPDSRRLNRRIEIVMLPNLDVIAAAQMPG